VSEYLSSSNQVAPPLTLDQQIEMVEAEIAQLEATITSLSAEGHEVADAAHHLNVLLLNLTDLIRKRTKTSEPVFVSNLFMPAHE
jgi:hypothetical protein